MPRFRLYRISICGNSDLGAGMRRLFFVLSALVAGLAAPAWAQDSITLQASAPIIDAEINNRPVRLEVDLRFPRALALSTEAAQRLRVRRIPFANARIGIEGSNDTLAGRIARPRVVFEGEEDERAFAAIFGVPVTRRADGLVGPGVLPYNTIIVRLGPDLPGARDISFPMADADIWRVETQVGGETLQVMFDVTAAPTIFNRTASRLFDRPDGLVAVGDVVRLPLILGLETMMQPVETDLTAVGLDLGATYARTNAALIGATEPDAIVSETQARNPPPPNVTLGRDALAPCSSITVDRRARRLTLRCVV